MATTAYLTRDGGWGAWVRVDVADTPEADAAAAAFFRRNSHEAAYVDEELTTDLGPEMEAVFFPTCDHGMSAQLCYGPDHYPSDAQERAGL